MSAKVGVASPRSFPHLPSIIVAKKLNVGILIESFLMENNAVPNVPNRSRNDIKHYVPSQDTSKREIGVELVLKKLNGGPIAYK